MRGFSAANAVAAVTTKRIPKANEAIFFIGDILLNDGVDG
jgi:hypothetical protein